MSNMIKAYSVRYDDEIKKTIDTHLRIDQKLEIKKAATKLTTQVPQDGFVEGLMAVVVEAPPSNEELQEMTVKMTEDAKNEAKHILDQAKKEAEQIKNDAYTQAQKKGYEDGMTQVRKEGMKLKAEYEAKELKLSEEYETMSKALEPQMAQMVADLVEKITGIVVEDKEEVILYLIDRAFKKIEKSDEYTIRVSKEDFEYVSMRKNLLLGAIGREVPLYINEDPSLKKNQCLIETELKVINCSLDIQLYNLITDLKLIGGI